MLVRWEEQEQFTGAVELRTSESLLLMVKYAIDALIGIVSNLWIPLGNMHILMMLILPVHEYGV